MDKEKKKTIIQIIILITLLIFFIIYNIAMYNSKKIKSEEQQSKVVVNPNEYYTVFSCANSFINYVQNGKAEEILLIIDKKQQKNKRINSKNVYEFVPKLNKDLITDYKVDKMTYKDLDSEHTQYFLEGNIRTSTINSKYEETKYNMIIILDKPARKYSVILEDHI